MNKRSLREAFVKHSGRYDLVGSKTVDGENMPDYDVDNGADYYVDAAIKLLSKEVLSTRNIRHFIKTATAAFPGASIPNITHVDQVAVGGTPLGMALEADLMLSMSDETLTGTPTHWAECRDITFTFEKEEEEEESEEPETTTILIYPYPIIDTVMYISCWIHDPLVKDTDENWWSINYPEAVIDLAHAKLCTSQLDASKRTLESEVERIKIAVYKQDVRDEVRHLGSVIK